MAITCVKCGAVLEDGQRFCTGCGTPVAAPSPAQPPVQPPVQQPARPVQPPVQQPAQPPVQRQGAFADEPPKGSKYEPISTLGFIGILLLMCIPVVGFILTVIWALGGCRKINKRNMARASLIVMAVTLVLTLIAGIVVRSFVRNTLKDAGIDPDALQSGQLLSDLTGLLGSGGDIEISAGSQGSGTVDPDDLAGMLGALEDMQGSSSGSGSSGQSGSSGDLGDLAGLLGALGGMQGGSSGQSGSSDLDELTGVLGALGMLGGENSDLAGLIQDAEDINQKAEAANNGWPSDLRAYPGGTATAVASYRTEITGTNKDEMLAYIEQVKKDGYKFTDFYDFGLTEEQMLSMNGWWGTNGRVYLSLSLDGSTLIVDHTTELPDLSQYFG